MRETWTDERLDDLNDRVRALDDRVDAGFQRMDEEFTAVRAEIAAQGKELRDAIALQGKELREEMKDSATGVHVRLDALNHNVLYGCVSIFAIVLTALIAMAAFAG